MFCHGGLLRNLTTEITERTESFLEILCDLCDLCGLFQSFVVAQCSAMGDFRIFSGPASKLPPLMITPVRLTATGALPLTVSLPPPPPNLLDKNGRLIDRA